MENVYKTNSFTILIVLSVCVAVTMIGLGIVWPLVPVYAVKLGASGFMVGMIIASYNISRVAFSPFTGKLSDRFGRKKFILAGLVAYSLVSFLYVISANAESLIAIRSFHGLSSLFVLPVAMALVADIAPENRLGAYLGTVNMAMMVGLGFGPVLGGSISDRFGFDAAFLVMGMAALLTFIIALFFVPSDRKTLADKPEVPSTSFRKILSRKDILGIVLMRFFAACGQGTVYSFLPIMAIKIGLSGSQVGIILTTNIFLIASVQPVTGKIADRINPKYFVIFGTFATALTILGMPVTTSFLVILLLNIIMGMANGFSLPAGMLIVSRHGRKLGMASVMTVTDSAWSLGMIVSPIVSGIILDIAGTTEVFVAGSVMILFGGIAVSVFLKDYGEEVNRFK